MVFNIIPSVGGLFKFFQRYGIGTVEEIIVIVGGFLTTTSGVYNPIFSKVKPKKQKIIPYTKEPFEMGMTVHLTVISNKERNKKFRLPILHKFDFTANSKLGVLHDLSTKGITTLGVIKSCLSLQKIRKIHVATPVVENNIETININTNSYSNYYNPIAIKLWTKVKTLSKLRVSSWLKSTNNVRISDSTYILEDVGNISDIEMLEIIGDINAIRH